MLEKRWLENPKTDCISINNGNTLALTIDKIIGNNNIAPNVLNINFGNIKIIIFFTIISTKE